MVKSRFDLDKTWHECKHQYGNDAHRIPCISTHALFSYGPLLMKKKTSSKKYFRPEPFLRTDWLNSLKNSINVHLNKEMKHMKCHPIPPCLTESYSLLIK